MIVLEKPKNDKEKSEALTIVTMGNVLAAFFAVAYPEVPIMAVLANLATNVLWIWRT